VRSTTLIEPNWRKLFKINTSSPPLPTQGYYDLYSRHYLRKTKANAMSEIDGKGYEQNMAEDGYLLKNWLTVEATDVSLQFIAT
jgi:hypothetical protein